MDSIKRRAFLYRSAAGLLTTLGAQGLLRADSRWPDERMAGPFQFHADHTLDSIAPLVEELAGLQGALETKLHVEPTREPVHVFLFQHKSTYQSYMKHFFPAVAPRRAMYIKQRGPGMVFAHQTPDLAIDLRHECTHALLHGTLSMVPLWLDEGLAEYFELAESARASENPYQNTVRWMVRFGQVPSLSKLERIAELNEMGKAEYRDSWAWVHFMLHGPQEAANELRMYLSDIAAQTPPGNLSDRLERRISKLNRAFSSHFQAWT